MVFDIVGLISMKNDLAGADDTLSLFIYILVKTNP